MSILDAYAAMHNTTEIISNCNKEELMEIINTARNLDDYKQSTDSEILQALINGSIQIGEGYPGYDGVLDHQLLHLRSQFMSPPCCSFWPHQSSPSKHQFDAHAHLVRLPDVVSWKTWKPRLRISY